MGGTNLLVLQTRPTVLLTCLVVTYRYNDIPETMMSAYR